jgi:hypothetical protein
VAQCQPVDAGDGGRVRRMKSIDYTRDGKKYRSIVRDKDNDPEIGLKQSPPDVDLLDWAALKIRLHNALMDACLLTLDDVQRRGQTFNAVVLKALGKPLMQLYQEMENKQ